MLLLQAQALPQSMSQEIKNFCEYAFGNTTFANTIIQFNEFDPTHVCKALTDVQDLGLIVTYNYSPKDTLYDILEVLAHESIHAHQLSDGRLQYALLKTNTGIEWGFMWEGKPFFYPKTAKEVAKLPWEIEAYARSDVILNEYKNFLEKSLKRA